MTLPERRERKGDSMRGRLTAVLTAALLMVSVAAATAEAGATAPKKCPSSGGQFDDHCEDSRM
jgi:hypothetical protein